ncbi:MAG: carbamoyltransferase HypF, partial [Cyclobacteriaceae bacterium]
QITQRGQQQIILRRSRGFAPSTFSEVPTVNGDLLALGAEMKGTFALSTRSNTYVSQYLGNLGHYENQVQFENVLHNFTQLIQASPEQIAIDAHSGYFTHQLGRRMAKDLGFAIQEVQHHEAHFAAVLAERQLLEDDHVLGVIWDGTGHGTDRNVWGGEFFDYSEGEITRAAHIEYFCQLANDRMAKDNRLSALSLAGTENRYLLEKQFTDTEWTYYTKSLDHPTLKTSSMGRVFDAVAFLAGISQANSYEGQSAMLMEQQAKWFFKKQRSVSPYNISFNGTQISLQPVIDEIFKDREAGYEGISARFHMTLVEMVKEIALQGSYRKIAFSGGVFQNGLLVDLLSEEIGETFNLYFHKELSPNDENIAYGQLAHLQYLKNQEKYNHKAIEQCV